MIFPRRLNLVGRHRYVLFGLLLYWPALFAATHIPVPDFVANAGMSDKKLHYMAYFVLVSLLWFVVSPHSKVNWKKAKVWIVLAVIVWYGAADEWLQGFVHRSPDVNDFWADFAGALTGLVILSVFSFWPGLLVLFGTVIFIVTNLTRVHIVWESEHVNTAFNFLGYAIFTVIWVQIIHEYIGLRKMGIKWWIAASIVPAFFLVIVKGYGMARGKELWIYDIATSCAGIASAIVVSYIACMPKRNAHLKE